MLSSYNSVKRSADGLRPLVAPFAADVEITVDRSGSMYTMFAETCAGVTNFVADQKATQKKTGTPTTVRITTFDDVVETMTGFDGVSIESAPEINIECLRPRNTTRLIDTAVEALLAQGRRVKAIHDNMTPEVRRLEPKVVKVFALLTDGHDNESTLYSPKYLNSFLRKYQNSGGVAMFLAAGQDAVNVGMHYGFGAKHSLTYTASGAHADAAMRAMTDQIGRVCSGAVKSEFSNIQRTSSLNTSQKNRCSTAPVNNLQRAPATGGMFGGGGAPRRVAAGRFGGGGVPKPTTQNTGSGWRVKLVMALREKQKQEAANK